MIVILCGVCNEEVEVIGVVFYESGFCIIEVLLNLFELLVSISFLCKSLLVDCIVGVGMVLKFVLV